MVWAWKPRFGLRALLIAVALCALLCALIFEGPRWWERHRREQRLRATRAALERPVTIRLGPPATLATSLKTIKGIVPNPVAPIYVDPVGLDEAGVTMSVPVTLDARGVPLKEAMTRLLRPLGLTHYVDSNGLVTITSEEVADIPRAD